MGYLLEMGVCLSFWVVSDIPIMEGELREIVEIVGVLALELRIGAMDMLMREVDIEERRSTKMEDVWCQ